jgi:peptidoglycan/LPS O-acetylase OafA/YrhL
MDVLPLHNMNSGTGPNPIPRREYGRKFGRESVAGLDAIRGFAALGVVLFHAWIPYLKHPMPGLNWSVRDDASEVADFLCWWTELFIMPLFLVMAGFLAWRTLQKRGPTALVRSRARRLLKPLAFGALIVLPIDLYIWVLGWVAEGIVPAHKLRSLKFEPQLDEHLWGLAHLWFLQYLFLYVVVVATVVRLRNRFAILSRFVFGPRLAITAIVLAGSVTLYFHPQVVWGFQHGFLPVPSKWFYSGLSFSLGVAMAVYDPDLNWAKQHARRLIAPAAISSIAAVWLGQWHLAGGQALSAQIALAVLTCASSILITVSLIGFVVARCDRVSKSIGYLAAASFWIYIVHHPILGLVHIDLKFMLPGVSPVLKTLIAFAITSGVCVLTYEGLVRTTALGRALGFDWQFPVAPATPDSNAVEPPTILLPAATARDANQTRRAA